MPDLSDLRLPLPTDNALVRAQLEKRIDACYKSPDFPCMTEVASAYEHATPIQVMTETDRLSRAPGYTGDLHLMLNAVYFPTHQSPGGCAPSVGVMSTPEFRAPFVNKWGAMPDINTRQAILEAFDRSEDVQQLSPAQLKATRSELEERLALHNKVVKAAGPDPLVVPL